MNGPMGMRPGIILLCEGTDTLQGKAQLVKNINACQAVAHACFGKDESMISVMDQGKQQYKG